MDILKPVPRKTTGNITATQKTLRNMLIALTMCLCYLLGKYFQSVRNSTANALTKISYIKTK